MHAYMHACMYACMHACIHACMYVCHACIHACMHACMYVCMYVCMHVCMYIHTYMHACMHVCMYACMHTCMYVCHACIHACMHVCMHACMYVCIHACMHACMHACRHVCMYVCISNFKSDALTTRPRCLHNRRNSFQRWYLWQKSFSIYLMWHVKIVIPTLKDCLVIYERFTCHNSCFELYTVENYAFLERGFSKWLEMRRELLSPSCFERKNQEKMGGRTSEMCMQVGRK